jgi:hypothetical protein
MKPMRFPPEILSDIIRHAARKAPQIITLSVVYAWVALQGLYERVELRNLDHANMFFASVQNISATRKILTRHRKCDEQYPAFATLVKTLYISFDHVSHLHFGTYKHVFRPRFEEHVPTMTNLENMIIDDHEGVHSAFSIMSREKTVYPTSIRTFRVVSKDIDFYKVN